LRVSPANPPLHRVLGFHHVTRGRLRETAGRKRAVHPSDDDVQSALSEFPWDAVRGGALGLWANLASFVGAEVATASGKTLAEGNMAYRIVP
jgi:hypothetical protein